MNHDEKVQRIARAIAELAQRRTPVRFRRSGVSHVVPNPFRKARPGGEVDVSDLKEILHIDVEKRLCVAEPGVTFREIVQRTIPLGLAPYTVPELEGITIGGAVSGCSLESMSYRHGGFHDTCLAYELVSGTGEVIHCSPEENADLFHMVHGSYGTLAALTSLTFSLVPVKPYVALTYQRFDNHDDFWAALRARCEPGDHDFVDAIIHGPRHYTLCLGTMVDHAPELSDYTGTEIYYQSTRTKTQDFMRLEDYYFRYDTECHWLTRTVPPLENKLVRRLVGRWFLGSTNLIRWSSRLRHLLRLKGRPDVVIDVFIPARNFTRFMDWYRDVFDFWPLWIVPYRIATPYPWLDDTYQEALQDQLFIDCAIYGKANRDPKRDLSVDLEREVHALHGIKTLISRNHYDETTFWSIYSKPRWDAAKGRLDPHNLFGDLYRKVHNQH